MSDDLVKFEIPAEFVTARVLLTPRELIYGYRHGWLGDRAVVDVALAALEVGGELPSAEEELALLLSDGLGRVPELLEDLARSSTEEHDPGSVWLFLALAWLHEHRSEHLEPLEIIEMLYADFDYPEEIEGLIRFMPPPPGAASGHRTVEQAWENFLSRKSAQYRDRSPGGDRGSVPRRTPAVRLPDR